MGLQCYNIQMQCYNMRLQHLSTQTLYSLLYRYLFEGCYFGAIMGSTEIAEIKCL